MCTCIAYIPFIHYSPPGAMLTICFSVTSPIDLQYHFSILNLYQVISGASMDFPNGMPLLAFFTRGKDTRMELRSASDHSRRVKTIIFGQKSTPLPLGIITDLSTTQDNASRCSQKPVSILHYSIYTSCCLGIAANIIKESRESSIFECQLHLSQKQ